MFLNSMTYGPISVVSEQYLYAKTGEDMGYDVTNMTLHSNNTCNTNFSDPTTSTREAIQAETVYFQLYLSLIETVPALVSVLYFGVNADRQGRKKLLILPAFGSLFQMLIYACAVEFNLSRYTLFAAKLVYGCFGASRIIFMGGRLYVSDTVSEESRPFRLIFLSVCYYIGDAIANIGLNLLLEQTSFIYAYVVVASFNILSILYVFFFMKESFTNDKKDRRKGLLTIDDLKSLKTVYLKDDGSKRLWKMYVLFLAEFCYYSISFKITYLFLNAPYCWDSELLGYFNAAVVIGR